MPFAIALGLAGCNTSDGPPSALARQNPAAPTDASSPIAKFAGTFERVEGPANEQARDAAIDAAVAEMGMLTRGFAKDKLKETNPVARQVAISEKDGQVTISMDGRTYTAPLDGSAVKVQSITGDPMDLSLAVGERLEQRFSGDEKSRVNAFRVEGDELRIHVTVHAAALPKDVTYELVYRRA